MLYVRKINLKNRNDSNVLLYEMTEAGSRVLDVGCACGDLSALLAERKNCLCVGLEADKEGVEVCRKRRVFDEVLQIDLNNFAAADYLRFRQSFDVIVCGDVLEHLRQPAAVLSELKLLLKPGGYFLVSLPNAAHASIKAGLLLNDWSYTELGILDKTHLRFFTAASIAGMFADAELKITTSGRTFLPPDGFQKHKVGELPPETAAFILNDPQSHVFQYVFKAVPASGRLRQENLKVLLPSECGRAPSGFMFKIKRFLLLKIPGMIRYIQKIRLR